MLYASRTCHCQIIVSPNVLPLSCAESGQLQSFAQRVSAMVACPTPINSPKSQPENGAIMAQCAKCGSGKLTEQPCPKCGSQRNKPISPLSPRMEVIQSNPIGFKHEQIGGN